VPDTRGGAWRTRWPARGGAGPSHGWRGGSAGRGCAERREAGQQASPAPPLASTRARRPTGAIACPRCPAPPYSSAGPSHSAGPPPPASGCVGRCEGCREDPGGAGPTDLPGCTRGVADTRAARHWPTLGGGLGCHAVGLTESLDGRWVTLVMTVMIPGRRRLV
jgi:hypothetical protein